MKASELQGALHSIFHAFQTGDTGGLKAFMSPDTSWEVPGRSEFSGKYIGPEECISMIEKRRRCSTPQLDVFGEDIATTTHHGVLMFAVTDHRASKRLTSHEIIVAGHGKYAINEIHHYIYELHEFDTFWKDESSVPD